MICLQKRPGSNSERVTNLASMAATDDSSIDCDKTFLQKVFARMLLRNDWTSRLDAMGDGALRNVAEIVGVDRMHKHHLAYMVARLCSAVVNRNRKKYRKQTVQVFLIYWLYLDGNESVPLYVGMTQNLAQRWAAHRIGRRHTATVENIERLRIKVVETICGDENAAAECEKRHIQDAVKLNPSLLNKRCT